MSTAQAKLDWINARLDEGRTVYLSTAYVRRQITKRTVAKWAKSGRPLFKLIGDSLYMGRGSRYDCMDYCKLEAV